MIEKKYPAFLYYKDDIYEIVNLYLGEGNNTYDNDGEYSYISAEETINLVRIFLSIFDCDYVEKFDKADKLLLTKEEIETSLQSNDINAVMRKRLKATLESSGYICVDVRTGQDLISILKGNTIKDVFLLLHEFVHSLSQLNGNLTEVQPILSELILTYYLKSIGYSELELDKYWNERVELLAPCGYFIDLAFVLDLLDSFKRVGFVTKEMLSMNEEQFNGLVSRYKNVSNIMNFTNNLGNMDFKHTIGFYKALRIYEHIDKDSLYSVFAELNGIGQWLDDKEFNNYIDMVITEEEKSKVRVRK